VHQRAREVTVVQGGARRLWDDVADIYQRWMDAGRPAHDQLWLTVFPDGGHVLSCDQDGWRHSWPLR